MQVCKKCILPETFPGITFDENGVCSVCLEYGKKEKNEVNRHFTSEAEVINALEKFKNTGGKYDVLVSASGGVDSSFALIQLVERYKLKPLVWHNDHGYEHKIATDNVRKLCRGLKADLVILQHDYDFMKKLWKCTFETHMHDAVTCFFCANILYWNAIELADRYNIKLVVNGYSKGQVGFNKEHGRKMISDMIETMLASGDMELAETFIRKYEVMNKYKAYETRKDLENGLPPGKIMVLPFFIFKFYKTDKEALREECKARFDWKPLEAPYPARTTNCEMNWLCTYVDLKKSKYSIYTDEYAGLVRAGEISRDQALKDLEFNPPTGLIERLAKEVGIDLDSIG